jgi:hypothetical protein
MEPEPDTALLGAYGEQTQVQARASDLQAVEEIAAARREIAREIEKRIVGQTAVIDQLLADLGVATRQVGGQR